jgi:hypothetical protein
MKTELLRLFVLIDGRGTSRSRVILPETSPRSSAETENPSPAGVPAWEMQSALELLRLNADNTASGAQHRHLEGYV